MDAFVYGSGFSMKDVTYEILLFVNEALINEKLINLPN